QYLVGFQTERRDLDFEEVAPQAAHEVDMAGRRLMAQDIFSRNWVFEDVELWGTTRIKQWRHRYTLLPAWVLFYTAATGEVFYFGINGQTGEAVGRLPLNRSKLIRDSVLISVVGVVVALFGLLRILVGA
ncbi:MAG: hypothetical protein LBJ02_10805, partial [Bifidobacteriaceae bacterium]|nr:hypothetical protein [Bifidobacteriaceae bacterium]